MYDNARGGNDTLTGNGNSGDANSMYDNARGGNDTLIGGDNSINTLCGDASVMYGNARGGNDTLIGGDNATNDPLWRRLRTCTTTPAAAMIR